jgi:TolB-like protein/Flp pilus assembly protein TadD
VAVAAAVLFGWAGSWAYARRASAEIRSVAVLPFVDLSLRKNDEWFCDGITEEVIDALAREPGLHVVARTSAFEFKGKLRDIRRIGQQLGVAAVLEGNVRIEGSRLRVTVQMHRTSDGYPLWSRTFDRPAQDAFAVPREIVVTIAQRLQIGPGPSPSHRRQPMPQAYNAYLEGRYFFNRPEPEALARAVARLEEATDADPEFALAWAWLSIAREYRVDGGLVRPNEAMPGSRDAAERAVALDGDCGESHLALGIVKLQYDWDWAGARRELDRAVELNPASALALGWRARWYETQGRTDEAMAEIERARSLDPLSGAILGEMVRLYLSVHQAGRAIPFAGKAVELSPADAASRVALASALWFGGQKVESRQMVGELSKSPAGATAPVFALACLSAQQGDPGPARQLLDEAENLPADQFLPTAAYARLAAAVEDWDRFFSWIEEAYDQRSVQLPYLRLSPDLPASDPRFAAFLERMNLPGEALK